MKKISISLTDSVPSPALILDPCTVESNIETMISIAGDKYSKRLRPHLKTHKMSEVTKLHLSKGINKFKASTIKEAEMAAQLKANDILLAHQPTGPNIKRLNELVNNIDKNRPLRLSLSGVFSELPVPPFVVKEWRSLD